MAQAELTPDVIAAAVRRRGTMAVFDRITGPRTALVVIDMQNAWLMPDGPFAAPAARDIVPGINRLAAALRAVGGHVVWIQHTTGRVGTPDYWATYFEHYVDAERRGPAAAALMPGSPYHELYAPLDVQPGDPVWRKTRFSLFTRNPIDPEAKLRAMGVDTLIVTGTATNICCESTAREAMMLDFRVFMPHDAVAAPQVDAHLAGLRSVMQNFADVRPVDEILPLMGR